MAENFYGKPEIFNSDQRNQFTRLEFAVETPGSWHSDQYEWAGTMFE